MTGGQETSARGTRDVQELNGDRRAGAGHAVDARCAVVAHDATGCFNSSDGETVGVLHPDAYVRRCALGAEEPLLQRKGTDAGEEVAAVLTVRHFGAVGPHLKKEIVDVGVGSLRRAHDRDLGRQWMTPAHAVDLSNVGRAHRREEDDVAGRDVVRKILGEKVQALRRAASDHRAANRRLARHADPSSTYLRPRSCSFSRIA